MRLFASLLALILILPFAGSVALADELTKAQGSWTVSKRSVIHFSVSQVGGGGINGTFGAFKGQFRIEKDVTRSRVSFDLQAGSVEAGDARITEFIKGDSVFAAESHPVISFRSTSIKRTGENTAAIAGRLTARGVTRDVTFEAKFEGQDAREIRFRVGGKMSRAMFGMEVGTPIYSNMVVLDMEMRAERG